MKKKVLLLFIICWSINSYSQSIDDDYAFTNNYFKIQLYDPFLKKIINDDSQNYFALRGQIFTLKSKENLDGIQGFCIKFWRFNKKIQLEPSKRERAVHRNGGHGEKKSKSTLAPYSQPTVCYADMLSSFHGRRAHKIQKNSKLQALLQRGRLAQG